MIGGPVGGSLMADSVDAVSTSSTDGAPAGGGAQAASDHSERVANNRNDLNMTLSPA
jgi:hypothetical protein